MVLCGMFAALVAIGAFIQIPVPYMDYFTLQFFFVLLAGLILGADKGAISVGCYVLLGLVGVPIFAAGGGIGYIFRPSFGYLVGFIVSAYVTGKVCEKLKASYKNYLIACLAGFVMTYAIGILYKFIISWKTLQNCSFSQAQCSILLRMSKTTIPISRKLCCNC